MREAVSDFKIAEETDPDDCEREFLKNKSLMLAATAAEHLLKSLILDDDWREVFSNPKKAKEKDLKSGSLHSKSFSECITYLKDKKLIKKGEADKLTALAKQRNKIVHMAHNVPLRSARSLIAHNSKIIVERIESDSNLSEFYHEELADLKGWMELSEPAAGGNG